MGKLNVYFPDDLEKKIKLYREEINLSKICQEAVEKEIRGIEEKTKDIKEKSKMEQVIERLRKEKREAENQYFTLGWKDGLKWAQEAPYKELMEVANTFNVRENLTGVYDWDPTGSELMGDYYAAKIEEHGFTMARTKAGLCSGHIPDEAFMAWDRGLITAIKQFWQTVRKMI